VVAEVKERLAVSKQAAQKFDMERFDLRKLSELEVINQYQIWISNRFAVLENFNDRASENKENIITSTKESLSLYELKQHKPWFDEECLGFWIKGSRLRCNGERSKPN
jgi:hypothetical protein